MKKTGKILRNILACIATVGLIVSAANIIIYFVQGAKAKENQQQTLQSYVTQETTTGAQQGTEVIRPDGAASAAMPDVEALRYQVNFEKLQAVNPEVCGWITVCALPTVNFPMVWCGDDTSYLHKGWEGEYNWYGAIFVEGMNYPDFLDRHTIVYGHNMMDGSMFGTLEQFKEQDFFKNNSRYIVVHIPGHTMLYEIFSVEYGDAYDDNIYRIAFSDTQEMDAFVSGMKERSLYDTGIDASGSDKILTVSTCAYIFDGARFVLHAKQVWKS